MVNFACRVDEGLFDEADELVDLGRECHHPGLGIHDDVANTVDPRPSPKKQEAIGLPGTIHLVAVFRLAAAI